MYSSSDFIVPFFISLFVVLDDLFGSHLARLDKGQSLGSGQIVRGDHIVIVFSFLLGENDRWRVGQVCWINVTLSENKAMLLERKEVKGKG